ncbi:MAG: hypothetical protein NW200_01485 [Hyphomonadaceae bacterium]|nr:hypothetical protein [Hyphomonadaceae bacterium]
MHAAILHAPGDEPVATAIAAKLSPAESFPAALRGDAGVTLGDQLALFAVWSARAESLGLGQALSRIAARAGARCTVVRADGTPLPALPTDARILIDTDAAAAYAASLSTAQGRIAAPAPTAGLSSRIGGWTPGVSIGLAIYAGMFVAAGAWRSDEVTDAIANGKAVPLASALHSFQVATADAWSGAVMIAQAPSVPSAAFVEPQRVTVTAALDTTTIPMVAPEAIPLAVSAPAPRTVADDVVAAPVRLHAIDAETIVTAAAITAVAQPIALEAGAGEAF